MAAARLSLLMRGSDSSCLVLTTHGCLIVRFLCGDVALCDCVELEVQLSVSEDATCPCPKGRYRSPYSMDSPSLFRTWPHCKRRDRPWQRKAPCFCGHSSQEPGSYFAELSRILGGPGLSKAQDINLVCSRFRTVRVVLPSPYRSEISLASRLFSPFIGEGKLWGYNLRG